MTGIAIGVDVALEPGTRLRSSLGRTYKITGVGDEKVTVQSPTGPMTVPKDELLSDIRAGKVEVRDR